MNIEIPSDRDGAIKKLEDLLKKIDTFPKGANLYRELYELITYSLHYMGGMTTKGFITKTIKGKLGDRYEIEFQRRIFFNELYLDVLPESDTDVKTGINILERKILHRQPVLAQKYLYDPISNERQFSFKLEIDQWWDYGEDNYKTN